MTITGALAGRKQEEGDQVGELQAHASERQPASARVEEDSRAAPGDDRVGVVADEGEVPYAVGERERSSLVTWNGGGALHRSWRKRL